MTWGVEDATATPAVVSATQTAVPAMVRPPLLLLTLGLLTAGISVGLLPVATQRAHLVGWCLGSLVTVGIVTAYTAIDSGRSQSPRYIASAHANTLRAAVAVVGVVAAATHSFYFATKIAS